MIKLETREQALAAMRQQIMELGDSDKFMMAVWKVENGLVTLVGRTTWEFPIGDLRTATALLINDLRASIPVEPPQPLPAADLNEVVQ